MQGLQLTADLRDCTASLPLLADADGLAALCRAAVAEAGLTAVAELFHRYPGEGGITGVVLLAESHLAVHTWPEIASATLDVYVCNRGRDNSGRATALLEALVAAFAPASATRHAQQRG
jgi:S-adenosylmethionine decarboxylase